MNNIKVEYMETELDNKFDVLIEKQEQREIEMKKVYDEYIQNEKEELEKLEKEYGQDELEEMQKRIGKYEEELENDIIPRKGITVKLYPNVHKKLKLISTSKETTLERIATSIVEDKIYCFDIVEYVSTKFEENKLLEFGNEQKKDFDKKIYDSAVSKKLINDNPRKRINVNVDFFTHRKLGVIAAAQDRSLDNIVSDIIETEIGLTVDRIKLQNKIKDKNQSC